MRASDGAVEPSGRPRFAATEKREKMESSGLKKTAVFVVLVVVLLTLCSFRLYRFWGGVKAFKKVVSEVKTALENPSSPYDLKWVASDWFDDEKTLELCAAIEKKDLVQIQRAIDSGADVNSKGRDNMPLILWASPYGSDVMELLLKNGADPNVVLESNYRKGANLFMKGTTYFFLIVEMSSMQRDSEYDYVELLLKHGADPNLGKYPCLSVASFYLFANGRKTLRLLVEAGADVNPVDNYFDYPVENAVGYGKELQLLLDHGAIYDVNTPQGRKLQERLRAYKNGDIILRPGASQEDHEATLDAIRWLEERGVSFDDPSAATSPLRVRATARPRPRGSGFALPRE